MLEIDQSELFRDVMRDSAYIVRGLLRGGFSSSRLEEKCRES